MTPAALNVVHARTCAWQTIGTTAALVLALAAVQACTSEGSTTPTPEHANVPADASVTPNRNATGGADVSVDGAGDAGSVTSGADAGAPIVSVDAAAPFNGSCPGFTTTVNQQLDWSAAGNLRLDTYYAGRLGADGVLVASFTTGSNPGYAGATVRVGYVYWPADQELNGKTMVVSKDAPACDLAYGPGWGRSGSSTSSLPLAYDDDSPFGYQRLEPNTTYYVTIANKVGGVSTCTSGNCEFRLEISRSGGI